MIASKKFVWLLLFYGVGIGAVEIQQQRWGQQRALVLRELKRIVPALMSQSSQTGLLRLEALFLNGQWMMVSRQRIKLARNCRSWNIGDYRVVLGRLEIQKRGGTWNRFETLRFFEMTQLQFVCVGAAVVPRPHHSLVFRLLSLAHRRVEDLRSETISGISDLLGRRWTSGIVIALLTGSRVGLSSEARFVLQRLGLWHICVISGMHVVWVFMVLGWMWKGLTLPIRTRFGWLGLYLDSISVLGFVFVFPLWFGFSPSSIRGLGFYLCFHFMSPRFKENASVFFDVTLRGCIALWLLALFPEFCHRIGFWMSLYASLGFCLSMRSTQKLGAFLRWFLVMIVMNVWMMPWVFFLCGEVMWPLMLISPVALIAVMGMVCLSVLESMGMVKWMWSGSFDQLPDVLLCYFLRCPDWCVWHLSLSEWRVCVGCVVALCVWLALLWWRVPRTHQSLR